LRLNSTVMALSPLGRIRGGESVAAMHGHISRFRGEVEFAEPVIGRAFARPAGVKSPRKFNELIRIAVISCGD
jgi:hypothetical protein